MHMRKDQKNLKDNKYYKKVYNMFNYKLEGIMEENFLPIGSVVKLKGGQKRLMITGA